MVKVAFAGGTGGIGRHVVEGLLETKKHDVVVLSRTPGHPALAALGVQVTAVSYDDPPALARALAGVHTVICTISGTDPAALVAPHLALLAAARAAGAARFVPSDFAGVGLPDDPIALYAAKQAVAAAARASGLETTVFANGVFMNYLACGTAGVGHIGAHKYLFDVEGCKASLPGDGERYFVTTRAEDVGRFVAASLDLEVWPEVCRIIGDRKTLNEIVKIAEAVRGKPFEVAYTPVEEIKKQLVPEATAPLVHFYQQTLISLVETERMAFSDGNLNKLCPQVKPVGIQEFLEMWWGKA